MLYKFTTAFASKLKRFLIISHRVKALRSSPTSSSPSPSASSSPSSASSTTLTLIMSLLGIPFHILPHFEISSFLFRTQHSILATVFIIIHVINHKLIIILIVAISIFHLQPRRTFPRLLALRQLFDLELNLIFMLFDLHRSDMVRFEHSLNQLHDTAFLDIWVLAHLEIDQLLNPLEYLHIVLRHQVNRLSFLSSSRRSTNAMDIVLGMDGNVIIDDNAHDGNIETARSHISRHQNRLCAFLEFLDCAHSLILRHLAVQRNHSLVQIVQNQR
mmetsp:Transcript_2317/g.3765  ORF Transcript_2317/g.3765 Transcript_2317/m.3765 type:complete len:273 (+) Transcript_2317:550-1368(+)